MEVLPEVGISGEKVSPMEWDVKGKKLLYLLSANARIPVNIIAKHILLSKDAVNYRINNLNQKRAIRGSRTVIDITKLGYDSYHIFLRLKNPSKNVEDEVIKNISKLTYVRAILKFYGSYDFEIAVIARNTREFEAILTEILEKSKELLSDYEILTLTKSYVGRNLPRSFLKDSELDKVIEKFKLKNDKPSKIDDFDFKIIKEIRDNAYMPLISIADKVKLSPDAVSYRLKKLEGNLIMGYAPVINYSALGYSVHVLLLNVGPIDEEKNKKLGDFFRTNENIIWAVKTIGRYNVLAYVCVSNIEELQGTITEIRRLFPDQISNYDTLPAVAEYKYTYVPDCLF